jgi:hypothetical protein
MTCCVRLRREQQGEGEGSLVAMTLTTRRRFGSHGHGMILLCLVVAGVIVGYWCLYEQCVRMPRVSLRGWSWPHYAAGGPQFSPSERRLPDAPAEWFFWPAFQLDRRLHPRCWADQNPEEAFAEFFRNGHTVPRESGSPGRF